MQHFDYRLVPAGEWRRRPEQGVEGHCQEARPHLIPISDYGHKLAIAESARFLCITGLCPGEFLEDGVWKTGYRFLPQNSEEDMRNFIPDLDEMVERFRHQD